MKIKCPLCDYENEEGSKFCKNCNEPFSKKEHSGDNPYVKKRGNEDSSFNPISDEETKTKNRIEKEEKIRTEAKKIKKKLTKEDYISSIVGCFITFFIATIIVHLLDKLYIINNIETILFAIGEAFLPTIIATTITLFTRSSIIGIGICSYFLIFGRVYGIFRDIYNMPPLTSNAYSISIFLLITIFGAGVCWAIKKLLTKR